MYHRLISCDERSPTRTSLRFVADFHISLHPTAAVNENGIGETGSGPSQNCTASVTRFHPDRATAGTDLAAPIALDLDRVSDQADASGELYAADRLSFGNNSPNDSSPPLQSLLHPSRRSDHLMSQESVPCSQLGQVIPHLDDMEDFNVQNQDSLDGSDFPFS